MQTAVIADQNGRNNVGKTNCGNIELAFLVSAIKEGRTSRRRRLQVQLAFKNRRRFLNLVCLLLLPIPKGTSQLNCDESRTVRSCRRFLQDSFSHFPSKTRLAGRHRTACLATRYTLIAFKYGTPQTEVVYAHQTSIYFVLSKQEEPISSRSSRHFVPED